MRSPGEDGYRTPTIEDAERTLSILGVMDSSASQAREVHSTALDAVLQKVSSRATDRAARKEKEGGLSGCKDHDYDPNGTAADYSASKLSWKKRIRHVTWAYFTITMATGGLANVLYQGMLGLLFKRAQWRMVYQRKNQLTWLLLVPFKFNGLETIGIVVFLINIALYLFIWGLLIARFYHYPYTFKASFLHPTESLFIPASIVSFGTILINISQFGPENAGPWLLTAVDVLFWLDAALAVVLSAGIYLLL